MEANELMIGDWVLAPETEEHTAYNEGVVALVNEHGYVEVTIAGGECGFNIDELEPIPLTSEIFEKNGFKLDEQDTPLFTLRVYSLDDDIAFLQRPKGGWKLMHGQSTSSQQELFFGEGKFVCMPIQYVHELQHALRLAGIKKEIVL